MSALSQLESTADRVCPSIPRFCIYQLLAPEVNACISGLVAEYIVAIDVTQARFPADAVVGVLLNVDVVICASRHI